MALVGETDTPGGVVPVPESATALDVPAAMTFRVPVTLPDATGANTTEALQWVPGAMMPFQVDVGEQSVLESLKGPDTVMLLTERPVVPVFVTQTLLVALVVPAVTDPKARLVGDRDMEVMGGGGGGGGPLQAPLTAHAVATVSASMSAPRSFPSVPAFL